MGIGVSLFLVAIGAILTFAVDVQAEGIDLDAVGVILMIIGGIGLLAALIFWEQMSSWTPGGRDRVIVRDRDVVDEPVVTTRRRIDTYR